MKRLFLFPAALVLLPMVVAGIILALGANDGQQLAQVQYTSDFLTTMLRTFGPAGTVGVILLFGVRWLAARLEESQRKTEESQRKTFELLTGVVRENTVALAAVQSALHEFKHRNAKS